MSESGESRLRGRIFTFYSYKGGTGRTMALANVAWILASRGKRVLLVDWDLEAPGLHRYLAPFLADPTLSETDGLMEFLTAYVVSATKEPPQGTKPDERWYEGYADITRYSEPLQWAFADGGSIDLVGAGRQNASYGTRVNGFDWDGFYRRFGGGAFLDEAIQQMKASYDFVLVDSRTGISDTSGICTIHLPDVLVVLYTLNNQSIEGASSVASHVASARLRRSDEPFPIFSVATRVELAEKERLEARRDLAQDRFAPFVRALPPRRDHPAEDYWGEMEVLYDPYYVYEETLATIADRPRIKNSILAAFERLTDRLTNGDVSQLGELSESKRLEALQRYARMAPAPAAERRIDTLTPAEWDIFISAGHAEREEADRLYFLLGLTYKVFYAPRRLQPGQAWEPALKDAIERSRMMLVLFSDRPSDSESMGLATELEIARERQALDPAFRLVPVKVSPNAVLPLFLRPYTSVDGVDVQEAALQIRRILGTQDTDARDPERNVRIKGELDQALEEKARLAERLAQLQDELKQASLQYGALTERAKALDQIVEAFKGRQDESSQRLRLARRVAVSMAMLFVVTIVLGAMQFYALQMSRESLNASRLATASYEASASNKELSLILARAAVETTENQATVGALRRALNTIIGSSDELLTAPPTILLQRSRQVVGRELTAEERLRYIRE